MDRAAAYTYANTLNHLGDCFRQALTAPPPPQYSQTSQYSSSYHASWLMYSG